MQCVLQNSQRPLKSLVFLITVTSTHFIPSTLPHIFGGHFKTGNAVICPQRVYVYFKQF